MKKLIVFDWGNVLEGYDVVNLNSPKFFNDVLKTMKIDIDEINVYQFTKLFNKNVCMIKTYKEMNKHIQKVFKQFNIELTPEQISKFKEIFISKSLQRKSGDKKLWDFIKENSDNVSFAILSNVNLLEIPKQSLDIPEELFVFSMKSCEEGLCKPNMNIYDKFQEKVRVTPANILFIDDKKENLIAPEIMGWNTYHYTGDINELIQYMKYFIYN